MTKRTVDSATGEDPAEGSKQGDNAAVSAGKSVLGVSRASRRWAQKLGVDLLHDESGVEAGARRHRRD